MASDTFDPNKCIPPYFKQGVHELGLIRYDGGPHPTIIMACDWRAEMEKDDPHEKLFVWMDILALKRTPGPFKLDGNLATAIALVGFPLHRLRKRSTFPPKRKEVLGDSTS